MINYEPVSDEHKVKDLGSLNGVSKMPLVSDNEPIGYVSIPLKLLIPTQLTFTTVYLITQTFSDFWLPIWFLVVCVMRHVLL